MPLIETDTIYAFLNSKDKYHENASLLLKNISEGKFIAFFSSVSLIELNYIYKTHKIEQELEIDLANLQAIKNIKWANINIRTFLTALSITKSYKISFFNSLHAGIAINFDSIIISENEEFDSIMGLRRIPLSTFKNIL